MTNMLPKEHFIKPSPFNILQMKNNQYIMLYANCIPVYGSYKSAIYDLQRQRIIDIPNDCYHFIQNFYEKNITELYESVGHENHEVITEYIQFLIDEEVVYFVSEKERVLFPKLNLHWDSPSVITNMMVDLSEHNYNSLEKIIHYSSELGCEHLYIKVQMKNSYNVIHEILTLLNTASIYSVTFVAEKESDKDVIEYEKLMENKRAEYLFLQVPKNTKRTENPKIEFIYDSTTFAPKKEYFFTINLSLFTEAQLHNTYFNRKLYINELGIVKNAPEVSSEFGNINELSFSDLVTIVHSETFQEYWKINKDSIVECSTCEYRYMCIDSRVPELNQNGMYDFTTTCAIKTFLPS